MLKKTILNIGLLSVFTFTPLFISNKENITDKIFAKIIERENQNYIYPTAKVDPIFLLQL